MKKIILCFSGLFLLGNLLHAQLNPTGVNYTNGSVGVRNPNNTQAVSFLDWKNNIARLRIGGNGIGASNGFSIQGPSDVSLLRLYNNGNLELANNVGIGIKDPQSKLVVHNSGGVGSNQFELRTNHLRNPDRYFMKNVLYGSGVADETFYLRHDGQMFVDGNVGIGTASPLEKLEVRGNIKSSGFIRSSSFTMDSGTADLLIYRDNDVGDWSLLRANKGNGIGLIGQPDVVALSVSRTTNNVGIGTTSPTEKLHVSGGTASISGNIGSPTNSYWKTGNHTLELENSDAGDVVLSFHRAGHTNAAIKHTDKGLTFSALGRHIDEDFHIARNGNIGIGTTVPKSRLVVKDNNGGMSLASNGIGFNRNVNGGELFDSSKSAWQFSYREERFSLEGYGGAFTNPFTVLKNGKIGIGTISPTEKLEVKGSMKSYTVNPEKNIKIFGGNSANFIDSNNNDLYLRSDGNTNKSLVLKKNGDVAIGTTDTQGFKLGVNGRIAATEVKVALYNNWPDYVFYDNYKLPTLKEVENHIVTKGHLKDIPSAKEVKENGIFLGDMNAKLLQKIEELTLYTIAQEKRIELQDKKMELLLKRLEKLETSK